MAPPALHPFVAGSATSYTPSRIFAYGKSFTRSGFGQTDRRRHETEPLRSPFVYEVFTKSRKTPLVLRVVVDFLLSGKWNTSHSHEPPRTRAPRRCKLYGMWPLSQPALTLDSPHLACPLAPPRHIRSRHKRTHATDKTSTADTQSVRYCHLLFTNATWIARACAC